MEESVSQVGRGGKAGGSVESGDEAGSSRAKQFAKTAIVCVDKRDGRNPDHAQVRGEKGHPTGAEAKTAGEGFNAAPAVVVNPQGKSDSCRSGQQNGGIGIMRGARVLEEVVDIKGHETDFERESYGDVSPGAMSSAPDPAKLPGRVTNPDFIGRRQNGHPGTS